MNLSSARRSALAVFILTGIAAAVALAHMDNLPAFIMIAPGYLVQAWLFETHRALGGFGYQVTMVGVSALVWSLLILSPVATPARRGPMVLTAIGGVFALLGLVGIIVGLLGFAGIVVTIGGAATAGGYVGFAWIVLSSLPLVFGLMLIYLGRARGRTPSNL